MQNTHKKRICIVSRSLREGGADRVAAMQSVFFHKLGHEVFVVTVLDAISYPFQGELLNLGKIKANDDSILGRLRRLFIFKKFLKSKQIDVIIDHRVRTKPFSEYIISGFIYSKNTIYMVHNYKVKSYFPPFKWLTKLLYKKAKCIVCVSEKIADLVKQNYNFKNVKTIVNPIDFEYIDFLKEKSVNIEYDYIFWYGRLEDEQKNISLLIDAYNSSELPNQHIKLLIMGNGKDKTHIEKKINTLKLKDHVVLLTFSKNPFKYIKSSKFTTLTSRYEGFPMTIIESLACGVPVISVKYNNYEDGLIEHKFNGLLVENNNPHLLAAAFNAFIKDKNLYLSCKAQAKKSVNHLNVSNIAKQWETIIYQ